jgi:hypothetical protein
MGVQHGMLVDWKEWQNDPTFFFVFRRRFHADLLRRAFVTWQMCLNIYFFLNDSECLQLLTKLYYKCTHGSKYKIQTTVISDIAQYSC